MTDYVLVARNGATARRVFRLFKNVLIEVYYHSQSRTWAAEAWFKHDEGYAIIGSTLDLKDHIGARRWTMRYLRRAIAERTNPKSKTVNDRVIPKEQMFFFDEAVHLSDESIAKLKAKFSGTFTGMALRENVIVKGSGAS
jgi:hypothetical protein